jgi:hypothetical protein
LYAALAVAVLAGACLAGRAQDGAIKKSNDIKRPNQMIGLFASEQNGYCRAELIRRIIPVMERFGEQPTPHWAEQLLRKGLADQNPKVVLESVNVLGALRNGDMIDAMEDIYAHAHVRYATRSDHIREAILVAYGNIDSDRSRLILEQTLDRAIAGQPSYETIACLRGVRASGNALFLPRLNALIARCETLLGDKEIPEYRKTELMGILDEARATMNAIETTEVRK